MHMLFDLICQFDQFFFSALMFFRGLYGHVEMVFILVLKFDGGELYTFDYDVESN